jgi:RNA polymerase subunit RPABC4/transcription elongation factor Spt4
VVIYREIYYLILMPIACKRVKGFLENWQCMNACMGNWRGHALITPFFFSQIAEKLKRSSTSNLTLMHP